MKSKIFSVLLVFALFIFIISFSIGLPIYLRPFYYVHISTCGLADESGYTEDEIREAYDEMLDYLTLPSREFGTGVMAYSESGEAHFRDCKSLFTINSVAFICSSVVALAVLVLKRLGLTGDLRLGSFSAVFWSAASLLSLFLVVGIIVSIDFYGFFIAFHKIFFPGKLNWYFDPRYDEIINVLPEKFFMNCALLITGSILIFSLTIIFTELFVRKKNKKSKHIAKKRNV